ncbi:hypothetical protein CONPUDRAFT_160954 [Coniophora puteana RWD-64-598 SS2]|uniref:Origin recognition complex subunit 5 n=1 Tax=Coniophora puteana (strain RWD-64-598) TaxID=741705 RepID=A0A5M3N5I1_CONPW|nr:uncharacterized protein CONPUDRAFT_160954 [Coniophora puteana RWD-64-598 SS2]EIW86115.1 hypothetical protein CONPUDRAFT_160954 [Coniophora puteana RWD-64-598 SS2]
MANAADEHLDLGSFDLINDLAHQHPGYSNFVSHLAELLASGSNGLPPFIHITDTTSSGARVVSSIIDDVLSRAPGPSGFSSHSEASTSSPKKTPPRSSSRRGKGKQKEKGNAETGQDNTEETPNAKPTIPDFPPLYVAHVNAVACFKPRLLYDGVLNQLAQWIPSWSDGCTNWPGPNGLGSEERWNDCFDSFCEGLRAVYAQGAGKNASGFGKDNVEGKGKGKAKAVDDEEFEGMDEGPVLVIVIDKAERLKENMPEVIVPLTCLAEVARVRISVILVSTVHWHDMRPPNGAAPDPYCIAVEPPAQQETIERLLQSFRNTCTTKDDSIPSTDVYNVALEPLYKSYAEFLYGACAKFTHDPAQLQYVAAARWPGFVQPILERLREEDDDDEVAMDVEATRDGEQDSPKDRRARRLRALLNEDHRLRLLGYFRTSITSAVETLLPRKSHAVSWAKTNEPPEGVLASPDSGIPIPRPVAATAAHGHGQSQSSSMVLHLPRLSKYILVASFLASTNPAKSDLRMFGRGSDERKRKRRRARSTSPRKGSASGAVKVAQRLVGPSPFPLDRLLAILGALLEENDAEDRLPAPHLSLPGEYTDMELRRVHVYAAICELSAMRALQRTTPVEKLDGPPAFKCGVSYEVVSVLSKELGIRLQDLMWDSESI